MSHAGTPAGRRATRLRRAAAMAVVAGGLAVARRPAPSVADRAAHGVLGRPRGAAADAVVSAVTDIGSVFGLSAVSAVLLGSGRPALAAELGVSGSLAWVVAQGTKELVERERPYELGIAERLVSIPAGSSWPSGHAAVAAAMASTLVPHSTTAGRVGAVAVAAGVAATRVYVGVHHLTDVASGAAIGVLAADVVRAGAARLRR